MNPTSKSPRSSSFCAHTIALLALVCSVTLLLFIEGCGSSSSSSSNSSPAVAPSITAQPQSQTVTAPATATFSVTASGTAPLSYQWSKNAAAISGATSATYTTPPTTSADSGAKFAVVVTNSAGSVTSNSATLSVNVAPSLTISSLSTMQAAPFSLLTITGSGWDPSGLVSVNFITSGGSSIAVGATSVGQTQILVGVPPLINFTDGTTGAGTVGVQLAQSNGSATLLSNTVQGLQIQDLPQSTSPVGTLTKAFTQAALNLNKDLEAQLAFAQLASGGQLSTMDARSSLEQLNTNLAALKFQVEEVLANSANTVKLGSINGNPVILSQGSVAFEERLLLALLTQLHAVSASTQTAAAKSRASVSKNSSNLVPGQGQTDSVYTDAAHSQPNAVFKETLSGFANSLDPVLKGLTTVTTGEGIGKAADAAAALHAMAITFPAIWHTVLDSVLNSLVGNQLTQRMQAADIQELKSELPELTALLGDLVIPLSVDVACTAITGGAGAVPCTALAVFFALEGDVAPANLILNNYIPQLEKLNISPPIMLQGTVTDPAGQAVSGALVSCPQVPTWDSFAVTLSDGTFSGASPQGAETGSVICTVSKAGYLPKTFVVNFPNPSSPFSIVLTPVQITVDPASLTFVAGQGGANPEAQALAISSNSGSSITWSASIDSAWLLISQSVGNTFGILSVSVDISGLAIGNYTGNVTIESQFGDIVTVPVTLIIEPGLTINPSSLTFTANQGGPDPSPQTATISDGASASDWTASVASQWLSISPLTGTTPSTALVSVSVGALTAGTYTSLITFSAPGFATTTLQVTLTVSGQTGALTGTWSGNVTESGGGCAYSGTMSWVLTQTGTTLNGTVSISESLTSGDPNICGSSVFATDTLQGSVSGSTISLTGSQGEAFTATVNTNTITGTGTTGQNPVFTFNYTLTKQ